MPSNRINLANSLSPSVELIGDWDKVQSVINQLPVLVAAGAYTGRMSAAKKIEELLKKNIRNNGPSGIRWPEYSVRYEARKAALGGNPDRKLRFTDTYYNNIKIIKDKKGIAVGLPKNVKGRVNTKNPLTIGQIAVILERGSIAANIQPRPLWKPTLREFGGARRVAYHVLYHIRRNIFLKTGVRAKVKFV